MLVEVSWIDEALSYMQTNHGRNRLAQNIPVKPYSIDVIFSILLSMESAEFVSSMNQTSTRIQKN